MPKNKGFPLAHTPMLTADRGTRKWTNCQLQIYLPEQLYIIMSLTMNNIEHWTHFTYS